MREIKLCVDGQYTKNQRTFYIFSASIRSCECARANNLGQQLKCHHSVAVPFNLHSASQSAFPLECVVWVGVRMINEC